MADGVFPCIFEIVVYALHTSWRILLSAALINDKHTLWLLALTLFMLRIFADNSDASFSLDNLAFLADRLYRRSYLHYKSLLS